MIMMELAKSQRMEPSKMDHVHSPKMEPVVIWNMECGLDS